MINKKNLILLLIFLSTSVTAQTGWYWLNPKPQGANLNSVKFLDTLTGFAAGNFGSIIKTTNGGTDWVLSNNTFTNDLFCVRTTIDNTIFVCGSEGIILKSSDNGVTWRKINSGVSDSLFSICFIDNNTGFIAGGNGTIMKTTDKGENWILQNSGTNNSLRSAYFFNDLKGNICGHGSMLRTTNGGINWIHEVYSENFNDITFLDANTGFAPHGFILAGIKKTTNAGLSWTDVPFVSYIGVFTSISFSGNLGIISGTRGVHFKTTNSGLNWLRDDSISSSYDLLSVSYVNSSKCLMTGSGGTIFKSHNSGASWQRILPTGISDNFALIKFINENTGYAGGNYLFKTTDAGISWTDLGFAQGYLDDVEFFNDTGYVNFFSRPLYKTYDGGSTWSTLNIPNDTVAQMQFANANTGIIINIPFSPTFNYYRTTNGGIDWQLKTLPHSVGGFYFTGNSNAYAFAYEQGGSRFLYKSTDLGETFNYHCLINTGKHFDATNLEFMNDTIIYMVTHNFPHTLSTVYKSTNEGFTWSEIYPTEIGSLKINFINENTGFLFNGIPYLVKTTNAGDTWNEMIASDRVIRDLFFVNENTGYIVGDGEMIRKTTTGGTVDIKENTSLYEPGFYLFNNYPNPFNPKTIIKYQIEKQTKVLITIYDLLGRKIAELINDLKQPGSYETIFDGSDLSSGIYICKMQVNEFEQSKRMVLLK